MTDYLTIEEVEARLPRIRPLLAEARRLKHEIELVSVANDFMLTNEERPLLKDHLHRLGQLVNELEDLGCYIKDLDMGLVDFITKHEGNDVFLCWLMSEPRVEHWHGLDEGFGQRQQILRIDEITYDLTFETPKVSDD